MITRVPITLSPEQYYSLPQSLEKYSNLLKLMGYCVETGREKLSFKSVE